MTSFTYLQPKNLKDASSLLKKNKGSAAYAGGTDMLGLLKKDILKPEKVVNLKSVAGMNQISYIPGTGLQIGALATLGNIAEDKTVLNRYPVIAETAKQVASPQIRNMGTIGGNVCQRPRCWYFREDFDCIRKGGSECFAYAGENKYHCIAGGGPCYMVHPSDMAVVLTALDARVKIWQGKQERVLPIKDFFVLPDTDALKENILKEDEIVTGFIIPDAPAASVSGFLKFRERESWDFAVVSVAASVTVSSGRITRANVVFGGAAPIPWVEKQVNEKLPGMALNEQAINEASETAFSDAELLSQNAYKQQLARNLLKRLLEGLLVKRV